MSEVKVDVPRRSTNPGRKSTKRKKSSIFERKNSITNTNSILFTEILDGVLDGSNNLMKLSELEEIMKENYAEENIAFLNAYKDVKENEYENKRDMVKTIIDSYIDADADTPVNISGVVRNQALKLFENDEEDAITSLIKPAEEVKGLVVRQHYFTKMVYSKIKNRNNKKYKQIQAGMSVFFTLLGLTLVLVLCAFPISRWARLSSFGFFSQSILAAFYSYKGY